MTVMTEFDYLVVGGTVGGVVAARLSEDPTITVGLLEWGPGDVGEDRTRYQSQWADMVCSTATVLGLPMQQHSEGCIDHDACGTEFFERGYGPEMKMHGSTSICYLHPRLGVRANLHLISGARATRIVLDSGRAIGVECEDWGERRLLHARREIVLSCGAIDTPHLLMLSGTESCKEPE